MFNDISTGIASVQVAKPTAPAIIAPKKLKAAPVEPTIEKKRNDKKAKDLKTSMKYSYEGNVEGLLSCEYINPLAITLGQHPDVTKYLLEKGLSPSVENDIALITAVKIGNYNTVKMLLTAGANPATHNNLPIITAAEQGYDRILSLLMMQPNTDPSALNNKALQFATEHNRKRCIAILNLDPRVNTKLKQSDQIESYFTF